ncbi:hypothetical protein C8F01DRAFT_1015229 [Mycena amicta]|nr:hypothetical protein C8F01DRAFT_1015229 [Mycena amicta]
MATNRSPAPTDPPSAVPPPTPRTLVLCFDGTSEEYNNYDTNAVKFFGLLKKDDWRQQLCYYQPGVGTYFKPSMISPLFDWCAKKLDEAIAFYLNEHVMDGYQFLMQNYHDGDRICLFGFSRGAYTARALAGMLHKVGLLPRDNQEQVPFAFKMYKKTSAAGLKLTAGYKRMFCQDVKIAFLGCWETVASVGLVMGRTLPFTAMNSSITTFRHALALDEHRVRFQPYLIEPKTSLAAHARETDALEVWFIGCHGDVGGGDEADDVQRTLADITLRWMVRCVFTAECGIRFELEALTRSQIALDQPLLPGSHPNGEEALPSPQSKPDLPTQTDGTIDSIDAQELIHDSLQFTGPGAGGGSGLGKASAFLTALSWNILEFTPMVWKVQDALGNWQSDFGFHRGKARNIVDLNPKFHVTVRERMQEGTLGYQPRAVWTKGTEVYVE